MTHPVSPKISVLAINQYYAPDPASSGRLLAELCEGLVERGMRVTVVAGQPSYLEGLEEAPVSETVRGVEIHRVSMGRRTGRANPVSRLIGYARFMWGAYRKSRRLSQADPPDVVLTMSNPPTVGLIGGRIANLAEAKFIYVLFDLFPDVAVASNSKFARWPIVALWNRVNRWIFSNAAHIAVPGIAMKETLVGPQNISADEVSVIPNWPRPDLSKTSADRAETRDQLGIPENCLLVLTAGNLGVMQKLKPLLNAARELSGSNVGFLFLGDGVQKKELQSMAESHGLKNVWFLDYQPEESFARILATSDVCVVALDGAFNGLSMPSRTYTYMSASKPILAIMNPEDDVARLVAEHRCGWSANNSSEIAEKLAEIAQSPEIAAEAGINAGYAAESKFSKSVAVDRYFDLIARTAGGA